MSRPIEHGQSFVNGKRTRTYVTWEGMKQRCLNRWSTSYPYYGGRGVKICERWLKFQNFYEDMGERPPGKSLDRYPNKDGDYEPGNCRWATPHEQRMNQHPKGTHNSLQNI